MKKILKEWFWFINGIAVGAILAVLGIWAITEVAVAATYNVFFNNVEQGPNSTASPTLRVTGSKAEKQESPEAPIVEAPLAPETQTAEVTPPTPGNVASTNVATVVPMESAPKRKLFRAGLLAHSLGGSSSELRSNEGKIGATGTLTFFPLRDLGITALAGAGSRGNYFYGGELEVVPLRMGLFGLGDFMNAGFVMGGTSLGNTAHAGVKLGLNFGPEMGLSAGLRTNITDRHRLQYWMADAGLAIHF